MFLPDIISSFSLYKKEISKIPLLSKEEEYNLAVSYRTNNDISAAEKLVKSNLRFVLKIANEYKKYHSKIEDIVQEGNIGLMLAVKKFDPFKNIRLVSYAVWWIRAQIHNFIMATHSLVKIGTTENQRKLFYKLNVKKKSLSGEEDLEELHQIALELSMDNKEVIEMNQRLSGEDYFKQEGIESIDNLKCERPNPYEEYETKEYEYIIKNNVKTAIDCLNEREQYMVHNRLMSETPITLQYFADKEGISKERARQIESNIIKKLKNILLPVYQESIQ